MTPAVRALTLLLDTISANVTGITHSALHVSDLQEVERGARYHTFQLLEESYRKTAGRNRHSALQGT